MMGPFRENGRYPMGDGPDRLIADLERATGLFFKQSSSTGWEFIGSTRQGFQVIAIRLGIWPQTKCVYIGSVIACNAMDLEHAIIKNIKRSKEKDLFYAGALMMIADKITMPSQEHVVEAYKVLKTGGMMLLVYNHLQCLPEQFRNKIPEEIWAYVKDATDEEKINLVTKEDTNGS